MVTRIHPLTGEKINGKANGHARPQLLAAMGQVRFRSTQSIDAARSGTDLDGHWVHTDALDPDSAYSKPVRQTLVRRSRYEGQSNGYYAGICETHSNMLVGVGPSLRMLTGNRNFNQTVERAFFQWAQAIQLRRKLWCMSHARTADGEAFGILQTNPGIKNGVQLDLMLIEAEQCQTPYLPHMETGYIDGIKYDKFNNIEWYDILPTHPGASWVPYYEPIRVAPSNVVHWFKLKRAGAHRGIPSLTSTLNVGASSRRHREAVIAAAESAADFAAIAKTNQQASSEEADAVAPFTGVDTVRRQLTFLPMGWDLTQLRGEHPNAQYGEFHRLNQSETARPISMPYNLAACDSSTYSFASGKLDTLAYRAALDVERQDCNDLILDRIFAEWFKEWTIIESLRDIPPNHQWDWPKHPIIDAVAEESARDTRLKNGTLTMRQAHSDDGADYEDQLVIKAEDMFGEATEENIAKARQIDVLRNTPAHAIQFVAQVMGIQSPAQQSQPLGAPENEPAQAV